MKFSKNYNIGLDIGTSSVGWAVTDDNFKIIRKGNKRKALWGVLLFDPAETAVERRSYRSSRRRYDRRRERIRLLQEIFQEEINKVDSNFFTKLKESFYIDEDKENKTIILTKEEKEAWKNYQNKYPTIYHLRNKLLTNKEKEDIRLLYLAIHHIIKYRGNFNYNTENFKIENINIKNDIRNIISTIIDSRLDIYSVIEPNVDTLDYDKIDEILVSTNKRENKKALEKEFQNLFTKKASTELANALVGYTINLENLLNLELSETKKIDFKAADFNDKLEKIEDEALEYTEIIASLKDLYDEIELKLIFKYEDTCSISNLMVKNYKKHHDDLKLLKDLLKNYPTLKHKLFKDKIIKDKKNPDIIKKEELCIYTKYVRNTITYADFEKELTKILEEVKNNENEQIIEKIYEEFDNETFMPRIADTSNGKYPYQINASELKIIIENQSIYYPFLKDEINGELKLVKLLKFRIPYYVGPLVSKEKSNFAWMVRKSNEKITPFNFDDIVDKRKSAKEFILRMLGHCSYLLNEYSMPTNSILYSKFKVLNELKQIKINDISISNNIPFMKTIYEEFFLKNKGSLTNAKFLTYLRTKDELSMYVDNEQVDINVRGYSADNKFANNMNSYLDFFSENGIFKGTNLTEEDADKIIELITIFEDKEILKEEILELYPMLSDRIGKIISKNYKGWSGLSKKLLTKKYYPDKESGIKKSILDLLEETKENFMQILNNPEYHFWDMINEENQGNERETLSYSLVENLATSPAVKKGIWESLKIVKEITDYMGYEPSNITIEMARGEDKKKGRIDDRKKQIQTLYEKAKEVTEEYKELNQELKGIEKITTEKLLLYFLQEGKSLYSGKPLDINNLQNYEVDHILPQTLIKDDSIDNKALVLKEENQAKRDNLVLPSEFRKQAPWWRHLKNNNLISNKKFNNLVRTEFKDKDIEGFINRQLVETRQITKHVANILKNLYQDTNIIYLKANISHNYRERFKLYKYRDLNDYHHAHDAYLASVLGIYQNKYLKTKINKFELKDLIHRLIEEKKYSELKYGYVINSIDQDFMKINSETGEVSLVVKDFTETIENTLYRNDIEVVKKTEFNAGKIFDETKNKKGLSGVPLKKGLKTEWYGAYTSLNPAYAILVRYNKNGNIDQRLIGIPIYYDVQKNNLIIKNYIANLLNIKDIDSIEILKDKIPFNTLFDWKGQVCRLVGATDKVEVCNAKEFNIEREYQIKWKNTLNRLFNQKEKGIEDLPYNNQLTEMINYVIDKIEKEYKLYFNLIPELRSYINQNTIENMDIETKEKTLLELFKLLKCNSQTANLKHLNEKASARFGRIKGKKISNATIIKKSPCGIRVYKDEF